MKVVRLHGIEAVTVEQAALPDLPSGWARVKVHSAGICGSDLHNFKTGKWFASLPVTPGHELFGMISEINGEADPFRVGMRVVADSRVWCGECAFCLAGENNLCESLGFVGEVFDGGFAEEAILPLQSLLAVPDDVPDDIAVLCEPLGVALRVVNQLNPAEGDSVCVAGGGTIGGLTALLLSRLRNCRVQLLEPNLQRYQLISSVVTLDPPGVYALAVEASGHPAALNALIGGIRSGGRIALVGIFHHTDGVDLNALVEREISLTGCSVFRDEQHEALQVMAALAGDLRRLVAPPISLDEVPETYLALLAGKSDYLKTVIKL
ncbi:zinc-dependent alcohol dehydrogenase [Pantoea cypripedii]|uniref:Alcohol dehydrogenase n=1 Tax=Pantoea cypripedii TaxID=55209 RepID=A0A1X1ELK7_PANCY|nr:alcohol dehydrogenase catalytic domain-containing protein [Pantoea cypripedii]MBP2200210.1 (R,R)-butanediol dehydrogenase/meso-butanediol dehydrogenase/diacetyl reductase [Pantoea cypripedii]ORM89805.1 alcohol dehydrogenase [Pantoea cypripedii]